MDFWLLNRIMKVNSVAFGFVSNVCLKCCWLVKRIEYLIVIWVLRVFAVWQKLTDSTWIKAFVNGCIFLYYNNLLKENDRMTDIFPKKIFLLIRYAQRRGSRSSLRKGVQEFQQTLICIWQQKRMARCLTLSYFWISYKREIFTTIRAKN